MSNRVAYIVSRYPAVSHTFVQREVTDLRALGQVVETFSVRRVDESHVLSEADRESFASTQALLPVNKVALVRTHVRAFRASPRGYVDTLTFALRRGGKSSRRVLWQAFYFAEAILLWDACVKKDVHHVHAHMANVASDVARLAAHFGKATDHRWLWSFTMHGPTEFADVPGYGLVNKANDADLIFAISDYCRSQLMAIGDHSTAAKTHVVHCGIDPTRFTPKQSAQSSAGTLKVLCVGRLVPEKGQALLIEATAKLRERGVDISTTLVGGGEDLESLRQLVSALGIESAVTLTGPIGQDTIRTHYEWADVFCLFSAAEGVPVVLMEAMATELATVSTRIAGIPELIDDGVNGVLLAPGRADLLADALEQLAADPAKRAAFGKAGREKVLRDFSGADSAAAIREYFLALA